MSKYDYARHLLEEDDRFTPELAAAAAQVLRDAGALGYDEPDEPPAVVDGVVSLDVRSLIVQHYVSKARHRVHDTEGEREAYVDRVVRNVVVGIQDGGFSAGGQPDPHAWHGYWCTGCGCAVEVVRHEGDGVVECGACGEWAIAVWT
jgi:hypothetical protein